MLFVQGSVTTLDCDMVYGLNIAVDMDLSAENDTRVRWSGAEKCVNLHTEDVNSTINQEGRMRECGECFSDKGFPERRDGKGQQKAVGT